MDHPRTPPRGVTIRPITAADRGGLTAFYAGLSDDSRQTRFHGVSNGISPRAATTFCGPDHEHREGFVAVTSDRPADPPIIVGHLCLEPAGAGTVEMAVAVTDERQGEGIGRALLEAAIAWAGHHAIASLQASMLTTNSAILGLLRCPGLPVRFSKTAAGVVTAALELAPGRPDRRLSGIRGHIGPDGPSSRDLGPVRTSARGSHARRGARRISSGPAYEGAESP